MHFVIKDLLSPMGVLNTKRKIEKIGVIFKAKSPVAVANALTVNRMDKHGLKCVELLCIW
jgi:hypothetical protein